MSNVLSFTLGLASGQFVSGMERAGAATKSFGEKIGHITGVTAGLSAAFASLEGIGNVVEGIKGAIERGAALEQQSKRLGESVGDIVKLQGGFKAVGLSADDAGGTLFRLQKALGGVNENGESTHDVFRQLGLNVKELKGMDPAAQLSSVGKAIDKLDNESAANIAGKIFGRQGAQEILQVSRSMNEFQAGVKGAAASAEIFQRNAAAFEHLELTITTIKGKVGTMFAGIAEGAMPAIQAVADALNGIDLNALGQKIGVVIGGFTEAFKEGKLIEIIANSVKTGFSIAMDFLPALFEKMGVFLLRVFETPLTYIQAVIEWLVAKGQNLMAMFTGGPKIESSFEAIYKDRKEEGLKLGLGSGMSLDELSKSADQAFTEAMKNGMVSFKEWFGKLSELNAKLPKTTTGEAAKKTALNLPPPDTTPIKNLESTNLEKFGFVTGLRSTSLDPNKETAKNTAAMLKELQRLGHNQPVGGNSGVVREAW